LNVSTESVFIFDCVVEHPIKNIRPRRVVIFFIDYLILFYV